MSGIYSNVYVLVDDDDFKELSKYKWYYHPTRHYQSAYINSQRVSLHRYIMTINNYNIENLSIDHINGNVLDNRKDNLRICKHFENTKNRKLQKNNKSGYKGVEIRNNKYRVRLFCNGNRVYHKTFDNPIDAAKAYDEQAKKYFGEFANLNFKD